jgi:hypothetical protein
LYAERLDAGWPVCRNLRPPVVHFPAGLTAVMTDKIGLTAALADGRKGAAPQPDSTGTEPR